MPLGSFAELFLQLCCRKFYKCRQSKASLKRKLQVTATRQCNSNERSTVIATRSDESS